MSRYLSPVSEAGLLAIGGHSFHGRNMNTTRSQSTRHRGSVPQTPATPPSSATRRRPRGQNVSTRQADLSGDDDRDDQGSPDAEALVERIRFRALTLLSLYAPEGMLPHEVLPRYEGPLSAECVMFKAAMTYTASRFTTTACIQQLSRCFSSGDVTWTTAMTNRLVELTATCIRDYENPANIAFDAIAALDEFERIFKACYWLFVQQIFGGQSSDLADVMVKILEIVIVHGDNDHHSPYSTGQNEYNLYRRFVMDDDHFVWALDLLRRLIGEDGDTAGPFKEHSLRFRDMLQTVARRHEGAEADSPTYRLQEGLRQIWNCTSLDD